VRLILIPAEGIADSAGTIFLDENEFHPIGMMLCDRSNPRFRVTLGVSANEYRNGGTARGTRVHEVQHMLLVRRRSHAVIAHPCDVARSSDIDFDFLGYREK